MRNYIEKALLNIQNGLLTGSMEFTPGLNIVSGENGTFKTKLLQSLKSSNIAKIPNQQLRIQAISPKRNSERRTAEAIFQYFRQQNRTFETLVNERSSTQINDTTFEVYPSLGDLYYLVFEYRSKDGQNRIEHMKELTYEFNQVIQSIFQHYELVSVWNETLGAPGIRIRKNGLVEFPIEGLSLGEQDILSLTVSLFVARDRFDVFLIDEPEVHLNWHLEEKLFTFLERICDEYEKQIIVVTHSRTIFKPGFIDKAMFLYWSSDRVVWSKQLTQDLQQRLAGDAVEIINLGNPTRPVFFVEDSAHSRVLKALAMELEVSISVSECGNSSNVKSIYQYSKQTGEWRNSFFLVDGDNEGNRFRGDSHFIHLPVYCIENYLISPEVIAKMQDISVREAKTIILESIKNRSGQIFRKLRFFESLIDGLDLEYITFERLAGLDASEIIHTIADRLGYDIGDYTNKYIHTCVINDVIDTLFSPDLLMALRIK